MPGWLMADGTLWILHVGDMAAMPVTIYSPMLFPSEPNGTATLLLKGAKHVQDNIGGSRTELTLCLESGLGVNRIRPMRPSARCRAAPSRRQADDQPAHNGRRGNRRPRGADGREAREVAAGPR